LVDQQHSDTLDSMVSRRAAMASLRSIAWLALIFGALYAAWRGAEWALQTSLCTTETLSTVSDVSGFDFEITETACDVLAKDDAISVFATKRDEPGRTLLFKYDPAGRHPIASISSLNDGTIQISVDRISSIFFQRSSIDGLAVRYQIGHVDYPR
jgi:hypothetical protein